MITNVLNKIEIGIGVFPLVDEPYVALKGRKADIQELLSAIQNSGRAMTITMPCGYSAVINELPSKDLQCGCGRENHWLIKYEEKI